ncbi:sodium/proline symporter PutP [Parvularcula sp. ZS-1/3]|uniref:Sodium/proline symporter n=1 Tax=Parvularcula mediterranea TaxID=2732508 RepID=A0A7Y3RP21_9PROT|nr:sodium/proline symporter PutP [Parvularcula mediterranea]NNU17654.1 sodium/proline symporter PutP [Parvularcula mediterranea]
MNTYALVSLAGYFVLMLGIGLYAYRESTDDSAGYLLGGRKLGPAVGALSAGASDMSGWMLLGLPGAVFVAGLSEAWIAVGLVIGAFFNYLLVAPRLRLYTEMADDAITIPDYFEKRFDDKSRALRVLSSVVIIIFFTVYTSSGVVAGGKLFEASFGLDYTLGLFLTASVVVAYTLFGGFLAVSLTDFVQGCIMFIALILVPIVTIMVLGGFGETTSILSAENPALLSMMEAATSDGAARGVGFIALISLLSWGLGYFGQPHIIVRFMAIRSLKDVTVARHIGMSWMIVTVLGAIGVGLAGRAYMITNEVEIAEYLAGKGGIDAFDAETIFIVLSQVLFHPLIAGFLLAAILAAIMSTISSQLLVSSSSLTEDFYKIFLRKSASDKELVMVGRISVLAVSLVAIGLALDRSSNILTLVSNAWFGFGSAFGPVILFSLFWKKMTRTGALLGMLTGAAVVLLWVYGPEGAHQQVAAIIPGFALATAGIVLGSLLPSARTASLAARHEEMEAALQKG